MRGERSWTGYDDRDVRSDFAEDAPADALPAWEAPCETLDRRKAQIEPSGRAPRRTRRRDRP